MPAITWREKKTGFDHSDKQGAERSQSRLGNLDWGWGILSQYYY